MRSVAPRERADDAAAPRATKRFLLRLDGRTSSVDDRSEPPIIVQRDEYVGGFGMGGGCDWDVPTTEDNYQSFVVVDEVRVPKVEPGEFILSWRWDVEQGNVRLPSPLRLCLLVAFY